MRPGGVAGEPGRQPAERRTHHDSRARQAAARRIDHQHRLYGAEYASTSYGAAKAALAAWTAGLSSRVRPRGLTANVIAPGYTAETNFFHGTLSEQRRAALIDATHNKRAGHPSDIAETTYFLASADARHITGQVLHVNGGAHTTR